MGQINLEIPDETHENLRIESNLKGVAIKLLVIDTLRQRYADDPELLEQIEEVRRVSGNS